MPRLRLSGAIPLLPLYAFMAWTEITAPYTALTNRSTENRQVSKAPHPSGILHTLALSLYKYTRKGCQIKAWHCVIRPKHETKSAWLSKAKQSELTTKSNVELTANCWH